MKLTKDEFIVLWNIEEGNSDNNSLRAFTGFDNKKIVNILEKLKKLNLIKTTKKFDSYYKEEFWDAKTTEKAKELYKNHGEWINELVG